MAMPAVQGVLRAAAAGFFLLVVLVTAWACLIAGLVALLTAGIGFGPALLTLAGGLLALLLLWLAVAMALRPPRAGQPGTGLSRTVLRGVMVVPGGLRLLLILTSLLFTLLAVLALLLATRRPAAGAPRLDRR